MEREFDLQALIYRKYPDRVVPPIGYVKEFDRLQPCAIVMKYYRRGDLFSYMKTNGPCPVDPVIDLVLGLLRCVKAIHDSGHIHGDICLRNFIIGEQGQILISDFEHALKADDYEKSFNRDGQQTVPSEMAPESYYGPNRQIYPESDIYQLGIAVFELVTGIKPFVVAGEFIYKHLDIYRRETSTGAFKRRLEILPNYPYSIQNFICACVRPSREQRLNCKQLEKLLLSEHPVSWLNADSPFDSESQGSYPIPMRCLKTPSLIDESELTEFSTRLRCKPFNKLSLLDQNLENGDYVIFSRGSDFHHAINFYDERRQDNLIYHFRDEIILQRNNKMIKVKRLVKERRDRFTRKFRAEKAYIPEKKSKLDGIELKRVLDFYVRKGYIVPADEFDSYASFFVFDKVRRSGQGANIAKEDNFDFCNNRDGCYCTRGYRGISWQPC
eukprot:TRINITY_DN103_c0_g1_i2.p1 TRINITY_DN103_c0_g1~~TRINITY_DN103_c0_g1_i2.p1  ORF type:complete len:441 (+),score=75.52 TRINITY_DN103_c0_g1_i2:320-1642(+)